MIEPQKISESHHLAALERYAVLDTAAKAEFDDLTQPRNRQYQPAVDTRQGPHDSPPVADLVRVQVYYFALDAEFPLRLWRFGRPLHVVMNTSEKATPDQEFPMGDTLATVIGEK